MESYIYPQTEKQIPQPLLHQSWSTGWNDKWLNGSTIRDRSEDPSHHERMLYYGVAYHFIEREREMFYLTTLNTFYLWLYGVRHMVKDHSDSEKGNPLTPYRLLLSINCKGSFICTIPQTG